MNIVCVNGSPKAKDSTSEYLLHGLVERLGAEHQISMMKAQQPSKINLDVLRDCETMVIALPLYVDGVPAHVLEWMEGMERMFQEKNIRPCLYIIINSGFFESKQNRNAIQIMKNWCKHSGLVWGRAVGIGGGGMAQAAPLGRGPCKPLGNAMDDLVRSIRTQSSGEDIYVEPSFPRSLYIWMAHMGWVLQGRKNGLSKKDLYRNPCVE